ncbi:hypothetical protein BSL82_10025 [Tardibacter chloracetimidivorans]|uniref:DUF2800 domain-containing protein n=1 Tax=Tardibacter chloracetimidivorans TaxID=1921510 RepID=A0A1L3ZVI9_9SPHN|nr:DUF2800 domain-containing protein [Tardibacter chloracetimidivorans]API59610.1 hypothetical protein BSL82_10025 [Tardibacter chloracetimidivorans]
MTAHARLSASGAHRWMACPASLTLEARYPESSSAYADEGTAAHELASMALEANLDADAYIGRVIPVGDRQFTVDEDMAGHVQTYLDAVRAYGDGHTLLVEQRVSYASYLGVEIGEDGFGTSDAIVITADGRELQVHDLKYGRGVRVDAEHNEQLQLYALGAFDQYGLAYAFERVRMVIHQPRLGAISEWDCTVEELLAFADSAKVAAELAMRRDAYNPQTGEGLRLQPTEKGCRFCKAKADCPALAKEVANTVTGKPGIDDIEDLTQATADLAMTYSDALGRKMQMVDLVEQWCKAVRARVEAELFAGRDVDGFKLVEGRRGHRAWRDKAEAEALLKSMRLKQEEMYDFSLISPTTAEKRLKDSPRRWVKVQQLITQPEGKPSVAPASDKRPALNPAADLEDLTAATPVAAGVHPFRDQYQGALA